MSTLHASKLDEVLLVLEGKEGTKQELQVVVLQEGQLGDDASQQLAEALSTCALVSSLRKLDLSHNSIGPLGLSPLIKALGVSCKKLEDLDLSFNCLGDAGADIIAKGLQGPEGDLGGLSRLGLAFNLLGPEGVRHLVSALESRNCGLRSLNLSDNAFGAMGGGHLAEALAKQRDRFQLPESSERGTVLLELGLSNAELGSAGVAALAQALFASPLKELVLQDNSMGLEGAKHLATLLREGNAELQSLNLWHNGIGDDGASIIAEALRENTALEVLNLGFNGLSDEGAEVLAAALEVRTCKLRHLNLEFNEISKDVAERLGATLGPQQEQEAS